MKNFKSVLSIILITALLCLSLSACENDDSHPEDQIINFILESDPLTLDPQIADDYSSKILIANLFEGLVKSSSDGSVSPGIAESWDVSDDGLEYTFHLAKDSQWSNGDKLTADDFVFGIKRALSPETRAENVSELFPIKNAVACYNGTASNNELGIKALDEYTLSITLEYPTESILNALSESVAMPCHEDFFNSTKGKYGKDAELIITNGAFSIRETYGWDHDKYIYIRRNNNYKGANPAIPLGVDFTITQKPLNPVDAIINGNTDLCEIYGGDLKTAEDNNLNITATSNTLWGICFNTDIPVFNNSNLRMAMLATINRNSLLENAPSSYIRTTQLIGSSVMFAGLNYRDTVGNFSLKKEENPNALFSQASKELSENNIKFENSYTVIYLDDDASSKMATYMIEAWNDMLSCYFNKQPLSRIELEERMASGNYEIAIAPLNTSLDSPMEFLSRFVTDSHDNYINLNYPAYNDFISEALKENSSTSISALGKAENHLISNGYLFPLYYESRYFASSSNLSGAVFCSDGVSIDFSNVIKTTE